MPQDSVLGLDPATIFASGQNKMSTKHFCHTYPLKSGRAEIHWLAKNIVTRSGSRYKGWVEIDVRFKKIYITSSEEENSYPLNLERI